LNVRSPLFERIRTGIPLRVSEFARLAGVSRAWLFKLHQAGTLKFDGRIGSGPTAPRLIACHEAARIARELGHRLED
jgi:hypothetical protein